MNHAQVYANIINKAKQRSLNNPLTCYKENHHIIPRCLGGSEEASNRVDLTAKEHFICHALLCYIHPNNYKLAMAFNIMRTCSRDDQERYISGSKYQKLRELASKAISNSLLGNTRTLGFNHSEETLSKMSKSQLEAINSSNGLDIIARRTSHMKGNTYGSNQSEERRLATSQRMKGQQHRLGIPNQRYICKYCNCDVTNSSLTMYHGPSANRNNNSCKSKSIELGTWPIEELLAA